MQPSRSDLPVEQSFFSIDYWTHSLHSLYNSLYEVISSALQWVCSCCKREAPPLDEQRITSCQGDTRLSSEEKSQASDLRANLIDRITRLNSTVIDSVNNVQEIENLIAMVGKIPELDDLIFKLNIRSLHIQELVEGCPNLVKFAQFDIGLDSYDLRNICKALSSLPNINKIKLEFEYCFEPLDENQIAVLARAKQLHISAYKIESNICRLPTFSNLVKLVVKPNNVTTDFSHLFTPALRMLEIRDVEAGWLTHKRLSTLVNRSPMLSHLLVSGSNLTDACTETLSKLSLDHLDIVDTNISIDGVCAILRSKPPSTLDWCKRGMRSKNRAFIKRIEEVLDEQNLMVSAIRESSILQLENIRPKR